MDPLSADNLARTGTLLLYARRYAEAIEILAKALRLDSNSSLAKGNLGLAYVQTGRVEEGISQIEGSIEMTYGSKDPSKLIDLAYAYSKAGRLDKVRTLLTELLETEQKHMGAAFAIGNVYAYLGEDDKAFEWLEKAIDEHSTRLLFLKADFSLENLQSDPRFQEILNRIGLLQEPKV